MNKKKLISAVLSIALIFTIVSPKTFATSTVITSATALMEIQNFDVLEQQLAYNRTKSCTNDSELRNSYGEPELTPFIGDSMQATGSGANYNIDYATHNVNIDRQNGKVVIDSGDYQVGFGINAITNSDIHLANERLALSKSNQDYSTAVKSFQYGIRYYTVINSTAAPNTFTATIDLPDGFSLSKATDFQDTKDDGSFLILKSDQSIAGFIDAPLAFDADGTWVPVSVEFQNDQFTYTYDISDEYTSFPITSVIPLSAESDWLAYYKPWPSESRGWDENYDPTFGRSLCFYQTGWASSWLSSAQKTARWNALYNYWSPDSQWYNTEGMKDQWTCHVNWGLAVNNSEWNLEPARPLGATIVNLCNPK